MFDKKKIYEVLTDVSYVDDVSFNGDEIAVTIMDGDWKHDHLRADRLMTQNFNVCLVEEESINESDCDCYSSIHYYKAI